MIGWDQIRDPTQIKSPSARPAVAAAGREIYKSCRRGLPQASVNAGAGCWRMVAPAITDRLKFRKEKQR